MTAETGTLWIVATPIGTLDDLGVRAREVLAQVDLILSEDTRRTGRLLSHAAIPPARRLRSYHDHNETRRVGEVLELLKSGASVALLSDAGTPVLSDPGYRLVSAARRQDVRICSIPGPSAFTTALAASGQPPLPATLVGFLPPRGAARRSRIHELGDLPGSLVILLSPHRLRAELEDLRDGLGARRRATLLAELSKMHERALVGDLDALAESDEAETPRGEYVVVIGPTEEQPEERPDTDSVRRVYDRLTAAGLDRREALSGTAERLGLRRRQVFDLLEASRRRER